MTMSSPLFMVSPKPWLPGPDHKAGVKYLLEHACAGLLADPGVGKTSISLAALKILKAKKQVRKTLIVAPLRPVYQVWPAELKKWTDFNGLTYAILHGSDKDVQLAKDVDIHITNLEGLEWLLQVDKSKTPKGKTQVKVDRARFNKLGYDLLIVDELSKFRHTTSQRFKALKQVISLFKRRWGLTGSPAANGLMGLFGQCFILDEGRTFGPHITKFRFQYFNPSFDGFSWDLKDGAEAKIYDRIKPLMLRLEAKGLPQLVNNDIWVDLPSSVRKVYDQLEKDLFTQIDGKTLLAANAAVASGKCRQIASGGIYLEPELLELIKAPKGAKEVLELHNQKTDALADLIDELQGQPLLVAYDFKHDLTRLQNRLGKELPYIGGGVSPKRGVELEQLWNAGKLPVLLGHPQSIGHGCNLQGSGYHIAWYTLTWDYELYDQFNRRIRRRGQQAKRVFVHHIMARDTTDLAVKLALELKESGQNSLFKALKTYRDTKR